jgi:hypothetical protein
MKRDFVVRLRFRPIVQRLAPLRMIGLAKLESDEPGHPSGQWSVVADLWSLPDEHGFAHGWLDFASPDAPKTTVLQGSTFPLVVGPNLIADVDVLVPPRREPTMYDTDFLDDRHARVRSIALAKSSTHAATL